MSLVLTEGQNLTCLFSPNIAVLIYPFQMFQSAKHKELRSEQQSVVPAGRCNSDCMAFVFMCANFSRKVGHMHGNELAPFDGRLF